MKIKIMDILMKFLGFCVILLFLWSIGLSPIVKEGERAEDMSKFRVGYLFIYMILLVIGALSILTFTGFVIFLSW